MNDLSSATGTRAPAETDEPWRVKPRRRRRRRTKRGRQWLLPVAACVLGATCTAAMLQLCGSPASEPSQPMSRPVQGTGAVGAGTQQGASSAPSAVGQRPAPAETRHAAPRQTSGHDGGQRAADEPAARPRLGVAAQQTPKAKAPRPRLTEHHERGRPQHGRSHAPQHTREPRKVHQPPAWVTGECRRRFPHDGTRQSACVAALKGYFK